MASYLEKKRSCWESALSYNPTGVLVLEDGSYFYGRLLTPVSDMSGEICFNTGMTGYQEVISDPSYAQQIVVFSFPHIGNVGVNETDQESSKSYLSGIIIGDAPTDPSNFRAESSFLNYLLHKKIGGLYGIDTRTLIKKIVASSTPIKGKIQSIQDSLTEKQFKQLALAASKTGALSGSNLTLQTGGVHSYAWETTEWGRAKKAPSHYNVAVLDFGVKSNILRSLTSRGARCIIFPPSVSAQELMDAKIDGVILSNGPGDPRAIDMSVMEIIKTLLQQEIPIFGICLGYQLLALIFGAEIKQLTCGHHGINHPVKDLLTNKITITSQNHEFVVEEDSLPQNLIVTHRSLFDGTLEGFKILNKPVAAVQFHPEASPGPHDTKYLFDEFISLMDTYASKK